MLASLRSPINNFSSVVSPAAAEFLSLTAFFICSTPSRVKRFNGSISSEVSFLHNDVIYGKVRQGNSDKNFRLSGPLSTTNGKDPQCLCCRAQLLSTFQHDPTIIAKRAVLCSRRWKWLTHPKICWWGNSIQSMRLIGYSTGTRLRGLQG
jgi:hypothetical protein